MMMFTMMMTMMTWDGMIRLMLHLIWPDSRRFRTSLTGSLWTFLCSTILQNVFEYICVFICSQQMMFVFCMELQDVLRIYTTPERTWIPVHYFKRDSRSNFFDTLYIWNYRTKYRQSSHRASDKGRLNPRQTRSPLPPPPLFSPASPSSPLYSTICHQLHHHHLQHHCFHVNHLSLTTTECNVWGQTQLVKMIFGFESFRRLSTIGQCAVCTVRQPCIQKLKSNKNTFPLKTLLLRYFSYIRLG